MGRDSILPFDGLPKTKPAIYDADLKPKSFCNIPSLITLELDARGAVEITGEPLHGTRLCRDTVAVYTAHQLTLTNVHLTAEVRHHRISRRNAQVTLVLRNAKRTFLIGYDDVVVTVVPHEILHLKHYDISPFLH